LVPGHEMGGGTRSGDGPVWELARDILKRLEGLPDGMALRYTFSDLETATTHATRMASVVRKQHGNGYVATRCRAEDGQAYLFVRRGQNYPKE